MNRSKDRRARLRFTALAWRALTVHHRDKGAIERASVAFGRVVSCTDGSVVLVNEDDLMLLGDDAYQRQHGGAVQVKPEVVRKLMWLFAQAPRDAFVSIHDHWFSPGGTVFSGGDDADDRKQDRYFREVFEPMLEGHPDWGRSRAVLHLSLVLDQTTLDARVVDTRAPMVFRAVSSVAVADRSLQWMEPNAAAAVAADRALSTLHARHGDFVTPAQQRVLRKLTVGIIGCGGVGPLIAENLARLGVGGLVLVDPDALADSNLNRWLAGTQSQVGRSKARLLGRRLKRALPWLSVTSVVADVLDGTASRELGRCDLLVTAVDNDAARFWANRFAIQHLVPLLDLGVRVQTAPSVDFLFRIVPVIPGVTACLECTKLRLLDRLQVAQGLDEITAEMRQAAGYVAGVEAGSPAVMGINTQVAGTAALEVLGYVCAYRDVPIVQIGRWRDARTTRIHPDEHRPDANCSACGELLGAGPDHPLPQRQSSASARVKFARVRELLVRGSS